MEVYEQLLAQVEKRPLIKARSIFKVDGMRPFIEIDQYEQVALIVAEVEFMNTEEENKFIPPPWFGRDISLDKRYSNYQLWLQIQDLR